MHIAFFCLPEHGGYVPTFQVTKRLIALGHRVTYFGPVDFEERVRNQGFDFVTLYPDEIGKGMIDIDASQGLLTAIRKVRADLRKIAVRGRWEVLQGIAQNDLARMLRKHGVDAVLVDGLFNFIVPLVAISGIPYRVYLTELSGARGKNLPPSFSGAIPGQSSALSIKLAWAQVLPELMRKLWFYIFFIGLPRPPKALMKQVDSSLRDSARRAGLNRSLWEYGWRWADAEAVLCSAAFDFPEAREGRVYAGPCIDMERKDFPFPWEDHEARRGDRKIVLVSLGTHAAKYGKVTERFLIKIFELASACPQLFFVVALGKGRAVESIGVPPENLIASPFIPQLHILERASLMITNGGLGTVKECIWFGVPMVVAPCRFDQPGNAARVVRHGLGQRVDVGRVTVAQLKSAVEACLGDPRIAENIGAMSAAFRASDEQERWLGGILAHREIGASKAAGHQPSDQATSEALADRTQSDTV